LHSASGGGGNTDCFVLIKSNTNQGFETAQIGDSIDLKSLKSTTRRGTVGKAKAHTIDTQANQAVILTDTILRRLTEIECERVHGFPDDWTRFGEFENGETKEISPTQRYKMLGNAVSPIVVTAIGKRLLQNE